MRVTKREMRVVMAQRPVVDFTEPALRPVRKANRKPATLLMAVLNAFRVTP